MKSTLLKIHGYTVHALSATSLVVVTRGITHVPSGDSESCVNSFEVFIKFRPNCTSGSLALRFLPLYGAMTHF